MSGHQDLSDGELRARLLQRDVPLSQAEAMIQERDDPATSAEIARLLD